MKQAASDQITRILAILGLLCGITGGLLLGVVMAARVAVADCEVEPCLSPANLALPLVLAVAGLLLSSLATYRAGTAKDRAMSLAMGGVLVSVISLLVVVLLR